MSVSDDPTRFERQYEMSDEKIIGVAAIVATILLGIFGVILREHMAVAQFVAVCLACLLALLLLWWFVRRAEGRISGMEKLLTNAMESVEQKIETTQGEVEALQGALGSLSAELFQGSSEQLAWPTFWIRLCELRAKIAADSEFFPDIVVSVGRSGATVGSILAGNLGTNQHEIKHIGVDRENIWRTGRSERDIRIIPEISIFRPFLKGLNVLCVMSECDTGFTLIEAKKELASLPGIGMVRTAVLFRNENAYFVPDYIAEEDKGARPRFPFREWKSTSKRDSQ